MKHTFPQPYINRIWRAIHEFDMINQNDKILIGLSGGKDSLFLTYALSVIRKYSSLKFDIAAFTLDPMFGKPLNTAALETYCRQLELDFFTEQIDIAKIVTAEAADPCFSCAFFRRGAVSKFATQHGFNKVALAHHQDDAMETFLMSMLYSGQIKTFLPTTYMSRTKLTVIRPLVYFREKEIISFINKNGIIPLKNPCPFNGKTKRQEVKELLQNLHKTNSSIYTHITAAMRENAVIELWPARKPKKQKIIINYHNQNNN